MTSTTLTTPIHAIARPLLADAPRVLVSACNRRLGDHDFHVVGHKYVEAVRLAGAFPLVVPAAHPGELDAWLDIADGVLLTGSPSNVDPRHYDGTVDDGSLPLDPLRDSWTLPLIRRTAQRGIPLLAICRGLQESNVALGGSLHQAVQALDGMADHRADDADPVTTQYGPAHPVFVEPGGLLERVLGTRELRVNSLHGQGIDQLAPGLRVEARAPDGLVEAFSLAEATTFSLCLQWHPEWRAAENPASMALLQAFGAACRERRDTRSPSTRGHRP
ncbi:gamma-glutamyl-gamma-aminobutyrate hydrolase family protein [Mitsuaria sp. GD03876]|uniref:gamma-glutamyl-gamma-aminobutyrate hydrolase family protein n=1 Tax=Mitsuaria sp. GD03876 TaxID=2975399 RepID=UPI002449398A|nr:gamma-glutamyl-gamma-aminobutyrate hydrolase family protein [Mitsuaria sp. GD03876]MDH0863857.1 gamma-glutamyl-gamma-aminobutyrate hydrolase family protein [Mitsuaria sp. GD03876]